MNLDLTNSIGEDVEKSKIDSFMKNLAKYLLEKFNQHRITLVLPKNTIMYENES